MKLVVIGLGYVGLSLSLLLSKSYEVVGLDINKNKIKNLQLGISPLKDEDIINYLKIDKNIKFDIFNEKYFIDADYVIVALPTNLINHSQNLDTKNIDSVVRNILKINSKTCIVIKSTIPIGYTDELRKKYNYKKIVFSPEFLREGKALYDNLYPSRIVIGDNELIGNNSFSYLLKSCAKNDPKIVRTSSKEAEAIKLFSNAYLAMRVAYFNELDTFSEQHNLNSKNIISAVCLDERIGQGYNNPSFGYGGYCLPKDTKQLSKICGSNNIFKSIVRSNFNRKEYILNEILNYKVDVIGIYKVNMKKSSDNYRCSSVQHIIKGLVANGKKVIIYDPQIIEKSFLKALVINNINRFIDCSGLIVANRIDEKIKNCNKKIYTRDIFNED